MDYNQPLTPSYPFEFNRTALVVDDSLYYDGTKEIDFYNEVEENVFKNSLKEFGLDYHYRHKPVNYKFNKLGYRTKNFEEIDLDNFFISLGCSFTEGVGLAEDEIWCSQLSQLTGMDCYNLGKGGAGCETVYINSLCFLKNSKHRPKFVAIQWPYYARVSNRNLNVFHICLPGFKNDHTKYYHQEIESERFLFTNYMAIQSTFMLWKLAGVPVISWGIDEGLKNFLDVLITSTEEEARRDNLARDVGHFGPKFHNRVSKVLYNLIRDKHEIGNLRR